MEKGQIVHTATVHEFRRDRATARRLLGVRLAPRGASVSRCVPEGSSLERETRERSDRRGRRARRRAVVGGARRRAAARRSGCRAAAPRRARRRAADGVRRADRAGARSTARGSCASVAAAARRPLRGRAVRVPYSPNARNLTSHGQLPRVDRLVSHELHRRRGGRLRDPLRVRQSPRARVARRAPGRPPHGRVSAVRGAPAAARGAPPARRARGLRASPEQMRSAGWFRSWFNFGGLNREVTIRRLRGERDRRARRAAPGWSAAGRSVTVTSGCATAGRNGRSRRRARSADAPLRFPAVRLGRGRASVGQRPRDARARRPVVARPRQAAPAHGVSVPGEAGYVARVGLREVRTRGHRLFLNGRRLELEGAAIQEDARRAAATRCRRDEMDAAIARLQRIGANATRAQHALSPALLERLDAAGILVWQGVAPFDVPGRWAAGTPAARERALRRVRLDVLNARAHPSIAGLEPRQRARVQWRRARASRTTSCARPGSSAGSIPGVRSPSTSGARGCRRRRARCSASVDAIGATNYEGWYANLNSAPATLRARIDALARAAAHAVPGQGAGDHRVRRRGRI